jgi:hypothetical protein
MKINRVRRHKVYVDNYIDSLRFDIINIVLTASKEEEMSDSCADKLNSNAKLIRKYERRKKILNY